MFVEHVIGGKHLSESSAFLAMVRGATPDVVLTAVEMLARGPDEHHAGAGDVVVVDVGGATTDVHSVVALDGQETGVARQVVAPVPASRTVEGDLGMRWSAVSTVRAGVTAGLVDPGDAAWLRGLARARRREPVFVPATQQDRSADRALATISVATALRRHAGRQQVSFGPDGRTVERTGKDLRAVGLLVGSGGVLRHNGPDFGLDVLRTSCSDDTTAGWMLPADPRLVVDNDYVLAAAGLLAGEHPHTAHELLRTGLQ